MISFFSQASAICGNKKCRWNQIQQNKHDNEERTLFVSIREGLFCNVCRGSGADLTIAAKSDNCSPDKPSEGNSAEQSIAYSDKNGKRLALLKLVDDLHKANSASN